jgi:heterotetrameric sarcosine oxidase gamma subunit
MLKRHEIPKRLLVGRPEALQILLGWSPPAAPNRSADTPFGPCLWLRPDQWLLLGGALPVTHAGSAAILDAGSRWTTLRISGPDAVDVIAAGCSLDLRAFTPGACTQTRIEQAPVILYRRATNDFDVLVERPLADYLQNFLSLVGGASAPTTSRDNP